MELSSLDAFALLSVLSCLKKNHLEEAARSRRVGRFSFCATRCPCTRPLASILHAVAVHAPDVVQPSHHAKVDDLLDGLRARVSAIIR
jgi:hypothetical protein